MAGPALARLEPAALAARGCEPLFEGRRLTVVAAPALPPDSLFDCAARGAHLLLVGDVHGGELDRFAEGRPLPWGAGVVMRARSLAAAAAAVATQPALLRPGAARISAADHLPAWTERRSERARAPLLAPLFVYVFLIVVCGAWVSGRMRRPAKMGPPRPLWVRLGWLPALATLATATVVLAGAGWGREEAGLFLEEAAMLGPNGTGESEVSARLISASPTVYWLRLPWANVRMDVAFLPRPLGSPFAPTADVDLREDRRRGVVEIDGLRVGRLADAFFKAKTTVRRAVPSVERRGRELWAVNTTDTAFARVDICAGDGWAHLPSWPARDARRLELRPAREAKRTCDRLPRDGYLIAGRRASHDGQIEPRLEVELRSVDVVVGPLAPEAGEP